jgi:hypothetical protein
MSQGENSLLLRIRGDASGGKAAVAETRAAVAQLRNSFGPELTQTVSVANKAFSQISDNLNLFVGQRIPLVGGAFVRVTENLRSFGSESTKSEKAMASVANSIQSIATESNKTVPQITSFLTKFVQIEGQANRDKAAIDFFGASLGAKLIPQLEETGTALGTVAEESASAGASIGAMAGPIGIAVVAIAALAAGAVVAAKEIFELAKTAADFQGKLFDLSQQTGVSVETLAALEAEARKTGGSIESVAQSLGIFQSNLSSALEDKGSKAAVAFHSLGVEATDTESALRQTIAALAKMPEGFEQTARARDLFGRGAKSFLAIAKETGGDLDKINERLKALGGVTAEEARLADEFNDQLVDLDIQLRGLGTKAIPVVLDLLKDLSKFLADNRILFAELQGAVQGLALAIAGPIKLGFAAFKAQLEAVAFVTERIKADIEFIIGHPIPNPFAGSAPPSPPETTAPSAQPDPFTQQLKDQIEAREKLQAVLNVDFAKQQAEARDALAKSQRDLEAGKIDRARALEETIAANKKETQSQIDALEVDRRIKLEKAALAKDDLKKQQEFSNQVLAIDAQLVDKRAALTRTEADLRAKARLDDQKAELAHQQERLDTLTKLGEDRIAKIEELIKREEVDRETGLQEIEAIENAALQARGQLLKKQLEVAGVGPDRQGILDKIKSLEADRTILERQQSERRIQITRAEFEQKRQILLSNIDALLQVEQTRGNAQIATIQAQAALRVKTEEQAAKEILAIRLRLLDSQIEATQAKEKAAAGIVDPQERRQTQTQLANDLKLMNAEREAIQEAGNRDIDEKRKEDLANERRYADELKQIKRQINDTERESANLLVQLLHFRFANHRDILQAELNEELRAEKVRHDQAVETIRTLEREARESNRTEQEKFEAQTEINHLREAEERRHAEEEAAIRAEFKKRAALEGPGGGFVTGLESGQLKILEEGVKSFQDVATVAFSAIGAAVNGLAQGVGNLVQQWALLGTTGPNAARKLEATVLATVAAQAAVQAVMELAYGFAALTPWGAAIYGPAPLHFKSAALFGSIAAIAGAASRGFAGGLFQTGQGGGASGGGTGSNSPNQINPVTLSRNPGTPPQSFVLHVNVKQDRHSIVEVFADDFRSGGTTRQVVNNDGGV